jgi:hypothetical protein
MEVLTKDQAYTAMWYFMNEIYKRANAIELRDIVSSMPLLEDGTPVDAGVEEDWQNAVDYALKGGEVARFRIVGE